MVLAGCPKVSGVVAAAQRDLIVVPPGVACTLIVSLLKVARSVEDEALGPEGSFSVTMFPARAQREIDRIQPAVLNPRGAQAGERGRGKQERLGLHVTTVIEVEEVAAAATNAGGAMTLVKQALHVAQTVCVNRPAPRWP